MNEISGPNAGWRTPTAMLGLLVLSSLILCGFWEGINHMVDIWNNSEKYGYGFFIPVISAYLIWQRRNILASRVQAILAGCSALILIGFFLPGSDSHNLYPGQYALVLCLLAVAYALMGWNAFKCGLRGRCCCCFSWCRCRRSSTTICPESCS